jgi:hypothetical protein
MCLAPSTRYFQGLPLLGVVIAILLQRRELQHQREELEETKEELKGQKDALLKQNELFTFANVHQTLVPKVILPIELELERTLYRGCTDVPALNVSEGGRWARKMKRLYDDALKAGA